ncbi:MAG: class I SAM-dependent methyltransferase [Hahellaceae bacterium]|nr:class I SAM-dependent methyltransferase [Hahellaceae bacterium]
MLYDGFRLILNIFAISWAKQVARNRKFDRSSITHRNLSWLCSAFRRFIKKLCAKYERTNERTNERTKYLDIGGGNGYLINLVKANFNVESFTCDYTDKLMEIKGQKVDLVDLNQGRLPYDSDTFDLITMTEVIEHLENHRELLKEISRVLKEGGLLVMSTPNILNIKSRIRFFLYGFWNLFGPMHTKNSDLHSTGGHINPIHYFYIVHSAMDASLEEVTWGVDKIQKSSLFSALLFLPIIKIAFPFYIRKERRKYGTIDKHNLQYVKAINSIKMLLGRTLVVSFKKHHKVV